MKLPPKVAPIQVVIIPITKKNQAPNQILDYLNSTIEFFNHNGIRSYVDDRPKLSPGYKFNEWEMKGVPVRIEVGPRDMESEQLFIARRDTGEKKSIPLKGAGDIIGGLLVEIQGNLFNQALQFRKNNTYTADTWDEFCKIIDGGGFVKCGWDGSEESENAIKERTKATIRCIPFDEKPNGLTCIYSGAPAMHEVIFSRAY